MQDLLVQATLNHKSGIVADAFVNTFAVQMPDVWDEGLDLLDLTGPFGQFYNVPTAGGKAIAHFLGYGVSRVSSAHSLRIYSLTGHLDGSPHGSPIATDVFSTQAGDNSDTLPEEVCLALTLRSGGWADLPIERADGSDPGTAIDRPRQRASGRVFLGPWTTSALSLDAGQKPRPSSLLVSTVLDAAERLVGDLEAAGGHLCVWSRVDAVLRPLDGAGFDPGAVQVDNAFDTQRRRGAVATVRTSRTV